MAYERTDIILKEFKLEIQSTTLLGLRGKWWGSIRDLPGPPVLRGSLTFITFLGELLLLLKSHPFPWPSPSPMPRKNLGPSHSVKYHILDLFKNKWPPVSFLHWNSGALLICIILRAAFFVWQIPKYGIFRSKGQCNLNLNIFILSHTQKYESVWLSTLSPAWVIHLFNLCQAHRQKFNFVIILIIWN